MKALLLLLVAASACFGSDLSGVWKLRHAAADLASFPTAIQVVQCGDHVQVLKIVSTIAGQHVEQVWLDAAAIRILARATELTVGGETWTISANGILTIHGVAGQRVVLEPADGVIE